MRRIQQQLLPLQHCHLLRHARRHNAVQMRVQRGHALRHVHVELVQVHIVAPPLDRLPVRGKHHAGNFIRRTRRPVIARNPLRRCKRQRPRGHRQVHFRVVKLPRRIGQVGSDLDRSLLRHRRAQRGGNQKSSRQGSREAKNLLHWLWSLLSVKSTAAPLAVSQPARKSLRYLCVIDVE